ncbi:MAG TPA: protein-glutamate O-methyltransferase CheR [Myxococcota bacterium]|nr:protein-glutamate O-methyltransferase CheR [Myxococcota bacterium]
MNVPSLERHEFDLLRGLIETWCGISLEDAKMYLVETRLREVVVETGCSSFGEFYHKAKSAGATLRDRIIDDMTTNETSWFRDMPFWETMRQVVIPDSLERARQDGRARVSIWSAASSTGQEPYTIALMLKEMERAGELRGFRADSFDILATDISRNALAIAEAGRYDPISMRRGLPLRLREDYFERDGRISVLRDDVRKLVRFKRMNLLDSFGNLGVYDIVLLRNVLIYFAAAWKRNILAKTRDVMRAEGTLAAGATETLELYSGDFTVVRHGRSTYYRLKEA